MPVTLWLFQVYINIHVDQASYISAVRADLVQMMEKSTNICDHFLFLL